MTTISFLPSAIAPILLKAKNNLTVALEELSSRTVDDGHRHSHHMWATRIKENLYKTDFLLDLCQNSGVSAINLSLEDYRMLKEWESHTSPS